MLRPGGLLVVCDHVPPTDGTIHSTEAEQHASLDAAGFIDVGTHLLLNGLYVCAGRWPDAATDPRNAATDSSSGSTT